jgi:hypothetical protein
MEGTTEYYHSQKPEKYQRLVGSFRFVRLGKEYCLIELQLPNPEAGWFGKSEMVNMCRLINPKASYQFLARGQNDPPVFVLGEKETIGNAKQLSQAIDITVQSNWRVGSAAYRESDSPSLPFNISSARKNSPERGGYIKEMKEETVEGERVVTLKMGYYFREHESKGSISFYTDHCWVVKDYIAENFAFDTGEIVGTFGVSNVYDFSDDFPKLLKTTEETKELDGTLFEYQISTITSIDFTVPDVSAFDGKRFANGGNLEDLEVVLPTQHLSTFQIVMLSLGILLILWGFWLQFTNRQKA